MIPVDDTHVRSDLPETLLSLAKTRTEVIQEIKKRGRVDLVVLGGGLFGAEVTRLAAFGDLSVLFLSRQDYLAGIVPYTIVSAATRSSGRGLGEALEEGIAPPLIERQEIVRDSAPALPWFIRLRGLVRGRRAISGATSHHLGGATFWAYSGFGIRHNRLLMEVIIGARQEGALALNYAVPHQIVECGGGSSRVGWRDLRTGASHSVDAELVLDCQALDPVDGRGNSLLNERGRGDLRIVGELPVPWDYPPIRSSDGRVMVYGAPLDRRVHGENPQTIVDVTVPRGERSEDSESLLRRAFVHLLPTLSEMADTITIRSEQLSLAQSDRSRRHAIVLEQSGGVLTVRTRPPIERAFLEAASVVKALFRVASLPLPSGFGGEYQRRPLPCAAGAWRDDVASFYSSCERARIPEALARGVVSRFGGRVRYLSEIPAGLECLEDGYLRGEKVLIDALEQGEEPEDRAARLGAWRPLARHSP